MNGIVNVLRVYRGDRRRRRTAGTHARRAWLGMLRGTPRGRGLRYVAMMLARMRDAATGSQMAHLDQRPHVFRERVTVRSTRTSGPHTAPDRRRCLR